MLLQVERKPDAIFCLGDLIGLGPDPAAVVNWFHRSPAICVQGDDDQALIEGVSSQDEPESAILVDDTLEHARRVLSLPQREFLMSLPPRRAVTLGGARFVIAHGHDLPCISSPMTLSEDDLWEALGDEADIILVGHTHHPALRALERGWLVNPGSLGQPRYGAPDATYAVWEDGDITIHHLHYPYHITAQKLNLLPLAPETVERLAQALITGV